MTARTYEFTFTVAAGTGPFERPAFHPQDLGDREAGPQPWHPDFPTDHAYKQAWYLWRAIRRDSRPTAAEADEKMAVLIERLSSTDTREASMRESDLDSRSADYVRIEIRRGNETTVYELVADGDDPVNVEQKLDTHVTDATIGVLTSKVAGPTYVNMHLLGRMATGTRTFTEPAGATARS